MANATDTPATLETLAAELDAATESGDMARTQRAEEALTEAMDAARSADRVRLTTGAHDLLDSLISCPRRTYLAGRGAQLRSLETQGLIRKIGPGRYSVTPKGELVAE